MTIGKPYQVVLTLLVPIGVLLVLWQGRTINGDVGDRSLALEANVASAEADAYLIDEKQRGAHVFGIVDSTDFQPLKDNNLDWVTMVCWGYQDDYDSPLVTHHNNDSAQMASYDSSWQVRIERVRDAGFKVFLKPHVWILEPTEGTWRADIFPTDEEDWRTWQDSYLDFILRYARIAERAQADMFCIGTEFSRLSIERPEYWVDLIHAVREVYSGKITYAANWYKEFENIPFWEDLDYIGIQAYFPLAKKQNPSVDQISRGWNKHLPAIESVYRKNKRKILFTEMGYRSTANSAIKPWEWIEASCNVDSLFSAETQANCYQAFFNIVWERDWFAGVHIWQLRSDFATESRGTRMDFTPQGKPAEAIMARGFE